jgi:CheY-like chemotaxis protein
MSVFVILLVDDDRAARQAAVAILERDGFRVLAARSGGEAIGLLERHPGIDLIITEIIMPGIGGFMLADIARVQRPDIKVLYLTGSSEIAALKIERLAGALLAKPVAAAALSAAVRAALDATLPPALEAPLSPSLGL